MDLGWVLIAVVAFWALFVVIFFARQAWAFFRLFVIGTFRGQQDR